MTVAARSRGIELMRESLVPPLPRWRRFGHPFVLSLALLGIFVGGPTSVVIALANPAVWITPLGWVLLAVFGAMSGFLCFLVAAISWHQLVAALRASNWVIAVADDGLYLKLRSYLNWHLPQGPPIVARVPFSAIQSVREVRERFDVRLSRARRVRYFDFLVITLERGVDTSALRAEVIREIQRVAPMSGLLQRLRTPEDVPVHVPAAGEIWVRRRGWRLLRLLAAHVRREPVESRHVQADVLLEVGGEAALPRLVVDLAMRGERSNAIGMVQFHGGRSHAEAEAFVDAALAATC